MGLVVKRLMLEHYRIDYLLWIDHKALIHIIAFFIKGISIPSKVVRLVTDRLLTSYTYKNYDTGVHIL